MTTTANETLESTPQPMMIEKHNSLKRNASIIAIRPYINPANQHMGLEKYNMILFENTFHEEPVICLEMNGVKRYVTGLNEFAPEVKNIKDDDERIAKIKEIRTVVSDLEKQLASNVVSVEDPDFWNKITLVSPKNSDFWDKILIRCGNEPVFLNPAKDPYDLIKLRVIEAGGFSIVAKNLEDARTRNTPPKFYLDKYEETAAVQTEVKKLRNKALSELQVLFDKNTNKLFYVSKIIDINSIQYRKNTPNDVMYDNMDKYINGESVDKDKRKTAQRFLDICNQDMETLIIRSVIKDASSYRLISSRGDGYIYHMKTSSMMGKNPSEVAEYLKNPLNEEVLKDLTKEVEKFWNS